MKRKFHFVIFWILSNTLFNGGCLLAQCFSCKDAPSGTIFCDDFEDDIPFNQKYFEYNNNGGDFVRLQNAGRDSSFGMRVKWQQGEVSAGSLSKSFGKTPDNYIGKNASSPDETFDEIFWRMDVKAQSGWTGNGPDKLCRALCLANSNWAEGMMAHLWSGGPGNAFLGMDPASGIGIDGKLKSTKYNDFPNLRWLGFKAGNIEMFSKANSGKWYCIVGHVKLNTPGEKDGIFEFWINDTLQASSANLDWHSTWNNDPVNMHINAIFFENYWNNGSPVEQERYFDNILISTNEISCSCKTSSDSNQKIDSQIIISPNPIKDYFKVESTLDLNGQQYFILSIHGSILKSGIFLGNNQSIDVQDLKPGMYILMIREFKEFGVRFVKN